MKKKSHQDGSILIEVLVAAIIFSVALFALTSFQANVYRAHSITGQQDIALELAESKMAVFRSYTSLTSSTTPIGYADITSNTVGTSSTVAGATYTLTWTVTDATNPTRKIVTITSTWNDSAGGTNTVTANSIIGQIDPVGPGRVAQGLQ